MKKVILAIGVTCCFLITFLSMFNLITGNKQLSMLQAIAGLCAYIAFVKDYKD